MQTHDQRPMVLSTTPFVKVLITAAVVPGSPEIVKNFGVGTYGPIRRPRIPLFKGGESVKDYFG